MTKQAKILIMFKLLILIFQAEGQTSCDTLPLQKRNVLWFTPSTTAKINGISLGFVNTPDNQQQTINGLSIELIGAGYITPLLGLDNGGYLKKTRKSLNNNGIIFGPTLFSGTVNGISLSGITGTNYYLNGFSFSLVNLTLFEARGLITGMVTSVDDLKGAQLGLANFSAEHSRGLQIGLFNRAKDHKGLQVGLWNVNGKRSLPLINW